MCQDFDLESDVIPQIAFLFAGGFGNTGAVCGAVCGAMMALSLKRQRPDTMDEMLGTFAVAQQFRRRFEAEMGSIHCRELTGMDLSTKEGIEQYMSSDIPRKVCFPAVGVAYQLVVDLLKETS